MWSYNMSFEKELYDSEQEKANNMKNSISLYPEDWVTCCQKDLKVGDIVYAEYFPDSQKYLYTYHPQYGCVQKIEKIEYKSPSTNQKIEEYDIHILNHNGEIVNLNKDHLSIYSRGYEMNIKKYELHYLRSPRDDSDYCSICGNDHNSEEYM